MDGFTPRVVSLVDGKYTVDDLIVHDEYDSTLAFILANMTYVPGVPRPMGIFQSIEKPSYEQKVDDQIAHEIETKGEGDLQSLLKGSNFWEIN